MKRSLVRAVLLFVLLAVVTGVVYPLAVTLIAGVAFPFQAHGSLITGDDGQVIGSVLIGQNSSAPFYFQGRPSATPLTPYNASHSGGSNLGPTNPVLLEQVAERVQALREAGVAGPIPADLVMASGSGLDPHISLDAALVQVPAGLRRRGVSLKRKSGRSSWLRPSIRRSPGLTSTSFRLTGRWTALEEGMHDGR